MYVINALVFCRKKCFSVSDDAEGENIYLNLKVTHERSLHPKACLLMRWHVIHSLMRLLQSLLWIYQTSAMEYGKP